MSEGRDNEVEQYGDLRRREAALEMGACIVNFRTTLKEIEALPELVTELGRELVSVKEYGK